MTSIFTKIVIWACGTLVLSLMALFLLAGYLGRRSDRAGGMIPRLQAFELIEMREVYESRGASEAARFLTRLDSALGTQNYFLTAEGKDVVTGKDHASLVAAVDNRWGEPIRSREGVLIASRANDGRYLLLAALPPPPFQTREILPYAALLLLAVGLLSWPLAVNIGRPLRTLAAVVDRFGQGDLSVRLSLPRRDEIGNLAGSFNRMSDRIETLLISERRLLQDVSHELRSPLARLSFAVELARTAADREGAFGRVRKEVARLREMIEALLEVTREEGDPASRARSHIAIEELVREIVEDCRVENVSRSSSITLLATDAVTLVGDRELLRRAIENVVRNAMYYAPEQSRVEIELRSTAGGAHILVRDYGPGVPEEFLTKIFQPFFRVDDARSGMSDGLGLGLSIALRAVLLHNGRISAANAHPGLRLDIELPASTS